MRRTTAIHTLLALGLLSAGLLVNCGPSSTESEISGSISEIDVPVSWLTSAEGVSLEPTATLDAQGRTWLAWLEFKERRGQPEVSLVAGVRLESGEMEIGFRTPSSSKSIAEPTLCALENGVYLAYEAINDSERGLFGLRLEYGTAGIVSGSEEVITLGPALFPSTAQTRPGRLEVVFQELVGEFYEIRHAVRGATGRWSTSTRVSYDGRDSWRPRCASLGDGVLHVVCDSFHLGLYGIDYAKLIGDGNPRVTSISHFAGYQGLPTIALDGTGRAWIAWEQAAQFGEIGGLRAHRELRLAAVHEGSMLIVPQEALRYDDGKPLRADFPRIACGPEGLMVTSRSPGQTWVPSFAKEYADFYTSWFTRVLSFDASGRAIVGMLPVTDGDGEATEVLLSSADGQRVILMFTADQRTQRRPKPAAFEAPVEARWRVGMVELPAPRGFPPLVRPPSEKHAYRKRDWGQLLLPELDGKRPLFGDLHRHTQLSRCQGTRDGTALDVYRYARGPGGLDFVSITDHYQHLTPWSHWRGLRDVDRFYAPGSLVTFAGIERALRERAHVNEVFVDTDEVPRSIANFHRAPDAKGSVPVSRTLAIPHMMGMTAAPFPWKFFRDDLHRLIEVYQGLRGSYEGAGLPYEAMNREVDASSIAEGQRRGLHFGLIASSDHRASSTAFAGVWAQELTRQSVFDALRARRTFGSTARVVAEVRLGELAMGDEGPASASEALVVRASGMAPVASVELIKNGELFERLAGSGNTELVVISCRRYQALGTDPPEVLEVRLRGGVIRSADERMRGETGGRVTLSEGRVTLEKGIPWIDFVLDIEREPAFAGGPVLELRLGELSDDVALDEIEPGRSIKHPTHLVRESIWRIGRPLVDPHSPAAPASFRFLDPDRRAGDSYYARVVFADGNLVWTSPIRVTQIKE